MTIIGNYKDSFVGNCKDHPIDIGPVYTNLSTIGNPSNFYVVAVLVRFFCGQYIFIRHSRSL